MKRNNDLLEIRGLRTHFFTYQGVVKALNGINLKIGKKEMLGLVGETGSGKSVTALSILRLIDPPGKIVEGQILFNGTDLLKLSIEDIRKSIRGKEISMIFQEPRSSLNPLYTAGTQIEETLRLHRNMNKNEAAKMAIDSLDSVGIADPEKVARQYPHELSLGMCQRVMTAMAISCHSKLLIADEATSSLDVTIEAQVLDLMKQLIQERGLSVLMITHNLGIVAQYAQKVAIMYAGNVVEYGDVKRVFNEARHPYTRGLLKALPERGEMGHLYTIRGEVPDMVNSPPGCAFYPRCEYATEACTKRKPPEIEVEHEHMVACFSV